MSAPRPPEQRPKLELVSVTPEPNESERRTILEAVREIGDAEHRAQAASLWLRSGRAQGRRLGMYDYRDRFSHEDVWRLSIRFPAGGREYPGLNGRGDAK